MAVAGDLGQCGVPIDDRALQLWRQAFPGGRGRLGRATNQLPRGRRRSTVVEGEQLAGGWPSRWHRMQACLIGGVEYVCADVTNGQWPIIYLFVSYVTLQGCLQFFV